MKGCKLCEMFEYQQQHQKLLLKNGSLTTVSNPNGLHTNSSRLLNYCNHLASIRRSSTGSSGSACDSSNGSPSMSSASSSSSLLSVPSPTTSLPSPVASSATPAPSPGRAAAPTAIADAAAVKTSATTTTPMIGAPQRGSTPAKATTKSLRGADSILSSADGKCSSSSAPASSLPAAAAAAAVNLEQPYHAILPPHFRDMFYATHLFRGYYQPAGPLISQHGLPSGPQPNSSLVVSTKQVSSPLDPERDHQLSQLSHQPLSSVDNPDNDVLITGGDLTTFRYPSQQVPPGQPPQTQALSALGSSQPPLPQQPQQGSPYSRQIHPMHYPPYPPSYYSPYPGDAMCYPPPYQHYFPAKVYQSAPTYRRYSSYYQPGPPPPPSDLYDPASTGNPAQPPPPQPGSQLVPTGPSGPQHIEHYPGPPGFYTGYSPGGGECYPPRGMQPPYMEYPAPCPCPMQSCPKNVLTGPLIGSNSGNNNINSSSNNNSNLSSNSTNCNSNNPSSMINSSSTNLSSITSNNNNTSIANNSSSSNNNKSLTNANQPLTTNKGPVRIQQHDSNLQTTPTTNRTNGQPILDSMHFHHHHLPCKMEILEPKPEIKSGVITEPMVPLETRKTGQYEETVIPPKSPAIYPANEKIVDTESLNTFRDSREAQGKVDNPTTQTKGLETDGGVTRLSQLSENKMNNAPPIVRKARIGKTMAREMYRLNAVNPLHQHPQTFNDHLHHHHHHPHHPSHNTTIEANNVSVSESHNHLITPSIDRIKKEEIKIEEEDDVVILEDEVKEVKTEPEIVEVHDKSSDPEDTEDLTKTDDDVLAPRLQTKRIKILDNKALCKKSSPNGYKSLIKQAEPKSYLCLSASKRDKKNHFRKYSKLISRGGIRKRKIVLTEQQKKRLRERRRILLQMEKDNKQQQNERNAKVSCQSQNQTISNETESSNRLTYKPQTISSTDYANDSRGYFSEPDIRSTASRKTKKTRTAAESRSKSETKKSKSQKKVAKVAASSVTGMNGDALQASSEIMPKLPETIKLNSNNSNHAIISQIDQDESGIETQESRTSKNSKPVSKSSKKKPKLKSQWTQKHIDQNECNSSSQPVMASPSISIPTTEPMDIDERIMDNDDDGLSEQNNNNNNSSKDTDYDEFMPMAVSNYKTSTCGKRARTRGYRFSKKRPKYRRCQTEVDDSIIPRRTNAVPKWNNGWSWLGEPFQAKVFLNSDDPLVIRTCYPAMQHIEGDIIRPRDCVLLKAGNKKNELPYVAKVAHLWENPEDGEMMMSLLWYYRPEHTEQGRQQNDCSDEVFASRHRDHNSVACIEDRCYVLTFSEYCRYRRRVRGAEEGIQNFNSIVPPLKLFANIPRVPVTTNPEQVMFCQRVYEFRLKRLLKTPTN